jgi:hypothetical protein
MLFCFEYQNRADDGEDRDDRDGRPGRTGGYASAPKLYCATAAAAMFTSPRQAGHILT